METYNKVSKELSKQGKNEFVDYVYYEWILKDIVLLHGNCHMEILKEYLLSSSQFRQKYSVYPYPLLISQTHEFVTNPRVFENIDVWIHEDIRSDNRFGYKVSDEYIQANINKCAKNITIPHLYGIGGILFPQLYENNNGNEAINDGIDTDGIFLSADRIIDECVEMGMNYKEILEFCSSDNAIPSSDILDCFNTNIEKLKTREIAWDIKISDFIIQNFKYEKLFYDKGHPTNVIMKYIARNVLEVLGIYEDIYCLKCMDANEQFVYPCVKKYYQLEWCDETVRNTGKKLSVDDMSFKEYIRQYLWWRHYDLFARLDQ